MLNRLKNNNGFTLIEILASIVILSIVIVSFLALFPQMSLFNEKTEENLEAVTKAKELLVEMKSRKYTELITSTPDLPDRLLVTELPVEPIEANEFLIIEGQYRGEDVRITINPLRKTIEDDLPKTIQIQYHEVKVDILQDPADPQPMSSTYGLIAH